MVGLVGLARRMQDSWGERTARVESVEARRLGSKVGHISLAFGVLFALFVGLRVITRSRPDKAVIKAIVTQAEALLD